MTNPSQQNPNNPISDIEKAAWAVSSEPLDTDAIGRVKDFAKQLSHDAMPAEAIKNTKVERAASQDAWKNPSKRSWLLRAVVATVSFLLMGSLLFFLGTQESAFAAALEKLQEVKTFSFEQIIYSENLPEPTKVQVYLSEDGRQRHEMDGTTYIMDETGSIRILLSHLTKTAMTHDPNPDLIGVDQLLWFESLKTYQGGPTKDLGEKEVEGHTISGTEIQLGDHRLNVWVDNDSKDLFMVEHFFGNNHAVQKSVSKNFDFEMNVDDSWFSFEVPKGYKTNDVDMSFIQSAMEHPEKNIAEALKGFAEASGGSFPKSLTDWGDWMGVLAKGKDQEANKQLASRIGVMTPFFANLRSSDYQYLGADLKHNQENREVVFWYKRSDGKTLAVFTDLSVGEIEASPTSDDSDL